MCVNSGISEERGKRGWGQDQEEKQEDIGLISGAPGKKGLQGSRDEMRERI